MEFALGGDTSTQLWVRWLVLRAVGVVYVLIFAGIVAEGKAILGPGGLAPAASMFQALAALPALDAFFKAPSLFWLSPSAAMITALAWIGVLAAVALVLNLWPRMALAVCWLAFVSFVGAWGEFTPAQLDGLMLETALLCIPFAPAGLRPGLGASSPPRPIAIFMMRWLLFRVMFESALVKLLSADPHWRNLTAMDVMYETSPSPTLLGYWAHQMPHAYHVFEIAVTFAAEIVAPLLAVFGGRRGRGWAFLIWSTFQIGILLTNNFGWLNVAALAFGLLLLDDTMLAAAASRLRCRGVGRALASVPRPELLLPDGLLWRYGTRAALGLHFSVTLYYFVQICGVPETAFPSAITAPVQAVASLRSANGYYLYTNLHPAHLMVEFEGSNDHGRTWRTWRYRHLAQAVDRAPPFTAPWFPRFENTVFFASGKEAKVSVIPATAVKLLLRNSDVMSRFDGDPFADRPPGVVRMRRYRFMLTDIPTYRQTGHYWRKEFAGDYLMAFCRLENGQIAQFGFADADAAIRAGNYPEARAIFEAQYLLGNLDAGYRLADFYARGLGVPAQPAKVFELFSELAQRGELAGIHGLGLCYEFGMGVPVDLAKAAAAYERAADGGHLPGMFARGLLSSRDRIMPRQDAVGLGWLITALNRATGDDPLARSIREQQPAEFQKLQARMPASEIAAARATAARRR